MSLLKQAIVDAANLKEAALKNAEQMILEKYSSEIKSAIDTLLEAEEDGLGGAPMDGMGSEATEDMDPTTFEEENIIPPSYMEGEQITSKNGEMEFSTPDEGETIDINISPEELAQFLRDAEQNDVGQYVDSGLESFQSQMDDEQVEIDLSQLADLTDGEELGYDEELDYDDEDMIELPDDLEGIEKLVAESFEVDHKPQPHGMSGQLGGGLNSVELENAIDMALTKAMSDEMQEENEELKDTLAELEEQIEYLQVENKRFKSVTMQLKDKLEESVVTNARLLYSNRVLISASLNERQKSKIVEALNNAHTVEEAKTIYETLQSTVRENTNSPQTLSEAITRNAGRSSTLPRRSSEKETLNEGVNARLLKLAGIK